MQHQSLYPFKSYRHLVSHQSAKQLLFFRLPVAKDQLKQHVGLYLLCRLPKRYNKLLFFNGVHLRQGRRKKLKRTVVASKHLISLTQSLEIR